MREQRILGELEPKSNPVPLEKPGISQGRQSQVTVIQFAESSCPEPVMWKRMGFDKGLTRDEAEAIHKELRPYHGELREYGWKVPRLLHSEVVDVGNEWQVYSYEQYIPGGDTNFLVASPTEPNVRKWQVIHMAIETLAAYPESDINLEEMFGETVARLPHGLDLKLANLVSSGSRIYFVDIFGPKALKKDGTWSTYNSKLDSLPPENLLAVCATRQGAILRLIRLAEAVWVRSGSIDQSKLRIQLSEALQQSALPESERDFIVREVRDDYPWLTSLYSESAV